MIKIEVWKDIKGYEGLYQVSNLGRVKSFDVYIKVGIKNAETALHKGRILKPMKNRQGYMRVELCKGGERKAIFVHRLVASVFIENPENKVCVNHIDGDKQNNCVENLEWCTYSENMQHAFDTGLKRCKYGKEHHNHSEVTQYDLQGNFIRLWYGFHEINRVLGFDYRNIHACCNGKQKTAYGYVWRYANGQNNIQSDCNG